MAKQTTKEVATKNSSALALPDDLQGDWGAEEVTSEDLIIPKLLLMHGQSEFVLEGDCNVGDLVISTTRNVVGSKKDPVAVIPFMMKKTWIEMEKVGNKYEWREEYPWTPQNSDQEWDYEKNGTAWRRDKTYNFYALLTSDLENGTSKLPIKLQFKRTSFKAGKAIANFFSECRMERKPGAVMQWLVSADVVKGKDNTYQVFTTKMGEPTAVEHIMTCKSWYDQIMAAEKTGGIKDHNVEEEVATVVSEEDEY